MFATDIITEERYQYRFEGDGNVCTSLKLLDSSGTEEYVSTSINEVSS